MPIYTLDIQIAEDDVDFTQTVELDGRHYVLRFTWNDRDLAWRLSIWQPDGTQLTDGRKIVLNVPMWVGEIDNRLPLGQLVAGDLTTAGTDPLHDELGTRVLLFYFDQQFMTTGT